MPDIRINRMVKDLGKRVTIKYSRYIRPDRAAVSKDNANSSEIWLHSSAPIRTKAHEIGHLIADKNGYILPSGYTGYRGHKDFPDHVIKALGAAADSIDIFGFANSVKDSAWQGILWVPNTMHHMVVYNILKTRYGFENEEIRKFDQEFMIRTANNITQELKEAAKTPHWTKLDTALPEIKRAIFSKEMFPFIDHFMVLDEDKRNMIEKQTNSTSRELLRGFLRAVGMNIPSKTLFSETFLSEHFTPDKIVPAINSGLEYFGKGKIFEVEFEKEKDTIPESVILDYATKAFHNTKDMELIFKIFAGTIKLDCTGAEEFRQKLVSQTFERFGSQFKTTEELLQYMLDNFSDNNVSAADQFLVRCYVGEMLDTLKGQAIPPEIIE